MPSMFRDIVRSLLALAALTVICGVAYPLIIWGIGQVGFQDKADGSLVHVGRPRDRLVAARPGVEGRAVVPWPRLGRRL